MCFNLIKCSLTLQLSNARPIIIIRCVQKKVRNEIAGWVDIKKRIHLHTNLAGLMFTVSVHSYGKNAECSFHLSSKSFHDSLGVFMMCKVIYNVWAIKRTSNHGHRMFRTKITQPNLRVNIFSHKTLNMCFEWCGMRFWSNWMISHENNTALFNWSHWQP